MKAYAIQKGEKDENGEDGEEKEVTLGLLNVVSYNLVRNKVIVVPVNGVKAPSAPELSLQLNAIYGQAVAAWEVEIDVPFTTDQDLVASLDEGESGIAASFPANMRKFNRKFKRSRDVNEDAYYVFLVDGVQTSLSGFMPFKRQYGYIFNNTEAKTIAHELGHGAFCLRHTFSDKAFIANQGDTDNLMDYSPAVAGSSGSNTKLYKHQWDNIHNPEKMIGWFQDDAESAMGEDDGVWNGNSMLSLNNSKLTEQNIEFNYRINKWSENIVKSDLESKNMSDYRILLLVQRGSKIVYSYSNEIKSGTTISWHGLVFADIDPVTKQNKSEFKVHLGIVPKENVASQTFKNWDYMQGSRPQSTVLKSGDGSIAHTFVDLLPNINYELTDAWFDWKNISDEAKLLSTGLNEVQRFDAYANFESKVRNQGYGIGDYFNSVENPIQDLADKMEEVDFLGTTIKVHKSFALILTDVKNSLGAQRMSEIAQEVRSTVLGMGIRNQRGATTVISLHSYGMVIDIYPKGNPFLNTNMDISSSNYRGEREVRALVKMMTGFDMALKSPKPSPTDVIKANSDFLTKVQQNQFNFDNVESAFLAIDAYNQNPNGFSLEELNSKSLLELLIDLNDKVSLLGDFSNFSSFYQKTKSLYDFLSNQSYGFAPYALISSGEGQTELGELINQVNYTANLLGSLNESSSKEEILSAFDTMNLNNVPSVGSLDNLISQLISARTLIEEVKSGNSFTEFGQDLNKWKNNFYSNELFKQGFCNIPIDLINAFKSHSDINWGGSDWGSTNVDYMHFEVKQGKIAEYLEKH